MVKKTKLKQAWKDMQRRCSDHKQHNYHRYGGRGIKVCQEWVDSFESFEKWAWNNGFDYDLTLDRRDTDKNYSPDNCRWVTLKVQANNTSTNKYIEYNGERLSYEEWGNKLGACKGFVWNRINLLGWSEIDAITIPKKQTWSRAHHIEKDRNKNYK